MPQPKRPLEAIVRAYQVGFGDCFLLTFRYASSERHVLVDFGTTGLPPGAPDDQMKRVAKDIVQRCGNKLHAVVATHRHQDHISGFSTAGSSPGALIRGLNPDVVLLPWTEDPDLDPEAEAPAGGSVALRSTVKSLADMQRVAASARVEARLVRDAPWAAAELAFLGEDNLKNASAVKNLMSMGTERRYLSYGTDAGLGKLLPGVTVTVLGPPTAEQAPSVHAQRAKDAEEYWHLTGATLAAHGPVVREGDDRTRRQPPLFPTVPVPIPARWLAARVRDARAESMLELVRSLDKVLNNTSLILLFEVNGKGLLFPGDAQIENWSYALFEAKKKAAHRKQLRNVALYKVGHHGSLNATPKTMWELFDHRGDAGEPGRLKSVMSTMPGKHGNEDRGTEVPRQKLVDALQARSDLLDTEEFPDVLFKEVSLKL